MIKNSNFVSPLLISTAHSVWTYRETGNTGYANQEGEEIESDDLLQAASTSLRRARPQDLLSYISEIRNRLELPGNAPRRDIARGITADVPDASPRAVEALRAFLQIAEETGQHGATWLIVEESLKEDGKPKQKKIDLGIPIKYFR